MKNFADGREIRIDAPQPRMPLLPEWARYVRKGVHAQPIEARRFNPPDGILQKIFLNDRILGIYVRQNSEEPAVGEIAAHRRRAVRISECFERIIRNANRRWFAVERILQWRKRVEVILRVAVEPIRQRRLGHPRMARPDVIGYRVEEKLHALFMQVGREVLVISKAA